METDYKQLAEGWKNLCLGWERTYRETQEQAAKATAMLLATSVVLPDPKLVKYAGLLRKLLDAANAIYITPKEGVGISLKDERDIPMVSALMDASRSLRDELAKDGVALP